MIEELAQLLHEQLCGDVPQCRRWAPNSKHCSYYLAKAQNISDQLEPAIGPANVLLAVRVITEEQL
jgi:hypothetical protein